MSPSLWTSPLFFVTIVNMPRVEPSATFSNRVRSDMYIWHRECGPFKGKEGRSGRKTCFRFASSVAVFDEWVCCWSLGALL